MRPGFSEVDKAVNHAAPGHGPEAPALYYGGLVNT